VALFDNERDLSVEAIDDMLIAAKLCKDFRKDDGGILGYPATLLLLCAADAICHSLTTKGGDTRLWALKDPLFNLKLTNRQAEQLGKHLTEWCRNLLAHNALVMPGVTLKDEAEGEAFDFNVADQPIRLRVPVLYEVINAAWQKHRNNYAPDLDRNKRRPDPPAPLEAATGAVSGVVLLGRGRVPEGLPTDKTSQTALSLCDPALRVRLVTR
jgi:hypothetical protein